MSLNSPQSSQGQLSHGVSSVGVRGVPHSFSSSSPQLQSAVAAAALVSRPGKHAHVSHRSVQNSKVSSRGIGGGRNVSGGSSSSTVWKKQKNSNTGRLTLIPAQLWCLTSALSNSCLVQKQSLNFLGPNFSLDQDTQSGVIAHIRDQIKILLWRKCFRTRQSHSPVLLLQIISIFLV